jgi:predicted RNA-binding protein with PUA domain
MIAFVVQINVKESNDLRAATSLSIEIIFGIFISLVVYVYSKRMHIEIKRHQEDVQKHIEQAVDQTANKIVEKVVDVANAQLRVKEGGKVALRKEGTIGADIVRSISENVQIEKNISDDKIVASNQVQHSTDSHIVTEQKINFSAGVVLIDSTEKQIEDTRKELEEAKRKLVELKTKNKKRKGNRKNHAKKTKTKR